jgi:hypothetical protein
MKIYIVQKQVDTIANSHYINVDAYNNIKDAFKYLHSLKMTPLNYMDKTQFMMEPVKEFGEVKYYGVNNELKDVKNRHKVITMEVK